MSALLEEKQDEGAAPSKLQKRPPYEYTETEIGEALALVDFYGGNVARAAGELGYPYSTVRYWLKNPEKLPSGVVTVRVRKREEFAELSDDLADWIAQSVTQADIDRAPLRDKAVSYGIFRDKSALDRGEGQGAGGATSEAAQIALKAIETLYKLAIEQGKQVTREEIVVRYCERKPELRPLLLPE